MDSPKILVYLPSPLGDAVLCTPALRAIRKSLPNARITFLASDTVRQILSPSPFGDQWIDSRSSLLKLAKTLRKEKFTHAVLFKNSFGSALTVFLSGIDHRIGYKRDARGILLTEKIKPLKNPDGTFAIASMVDYYLKIPKTMGCDTSERKLELSVKETDILLASKKVPELSADRPIVILVPGGAFGPSKCWLPERFAETAKKLNDKYNALVLVSVAPVKEEMEIANRICSLAGEQTISLADRGLTLNELKGLFSKSDLVITNDTGPRHIAIALDRKVITLFGPNDPKWTDTGHPDEIQIVGTGPCVPCAKPKCTKEKHICMESITVDMVIDAADKLISK